MSDSKFIEKFKTIDGLLLDTEEMNGRLAAVVDAIRLREAAELLKNELQMDVLMDLGGADYLGFGEKRPGRYCLSYQFFSSSTRQRAWLKVYVDGDQPRVQTIMPSHPAANWYEREVWDMYGIVFDEHPYLKRILLYEEFEGHPLRKDYPIHKMQPLIPMRDAVDYESVELNKREEKA